MSSKVIQIIGAIRLCNNIILNQLIFFLLKLPLPFFGFTTLFLYLVVKRSFAILFLFFTNNNPLYY